jgi:serine protease AprX
LILVLLFGAAPASPARAADPPRVLPQLMEQATAQPTTVFRVIVGRADAGDAADRYVASMGYRKLRDVGGFGFVAEVPGQGLADLGRNPAVRWMTIDAPVAPTASGSGGSTSTTTAAIDGSKLATVYDQTLNAPKVWSAGVTGKGVGIAVVDTGVNDALEDFKASSGGGTRVVAKVNTNASAAAYADGHGHGTHVAGIAVGNSLTQSSGSSTRGKYIGVAPGANLVAVRVSDDQGQAYLSDVIEGIEWVIANRATYNIRVLNLSLLSTVAESASTSFLDAAVERAWLSGILVVVAAGNLGPNSAYYPPANDPFVVTVGADDPIGTTSRSDDGMAPWSSYGTTQDGYSKPDVVAPGRVIRSNLSTRTNVLATQFPTRIVDTNYIWLSGTSVAAPMVAGVAALAFQQHPEWTNDAVKWLLAGTATKLGGAQPLPGQGAGLVDAAALVTYAGTPGVANSGLPISQQLIAPSGATTYASTSWSTTSWSSTSWSTTSWSTSSWSSTSWSAATPQIAPWAYTAVQ